MGAMRVSGRTRAMPDLPGGALLLRLEARRSVALQLARFLPALGLLFAVQSRYRVSFLWGDAVAVALGSLPLLGPLVAGATIDVLAPYLEATDGYQVLWPVCGVPVLAAIPLLWPLMRRASPPPATGAPAV